VSITIDNPYSGEEEESCSVSFGAQQAFLGSSVSNEQTEAEFNASKLKGEWGVILAKMKKGQIPDGTKVLSYTNTDTGGRGFLYVKGGQLHKRSYFSNGKMTDKVSSEETAQLFIDSTQLEVSIPQTVSPKPKPEPIPLTKADILKIGNRPLSGLGNGEVLAVKASGEYVAYNKASNMYAVYADSGTGPQEVASGFFLDELIKENEGWLKPDGKTGTPKAKPATVASPPLPTAQVAAPTPVSPVNSGSVSVGSMSHEDVSAMFVKIKDDLAKEQGLNVKGANPALDALVYKAIGDKTGYTADEVKAKIDAYKAAGNKLSALKKKVMAGTYKVPEGKNTGNAPQPTKASPAAPLNTPKATSKPVSDPKPNGVPTVATPKLADEAKAEVAAAVAADPAKVYSDEDVAAAYIIAKDKIVAASNGKWTLYTKSDELDFAIAVEVGLKTGGLNPTQQKQAIANYLGSGKKLSVLKKQLIKQGTLKPQADTLKKSGAAKTQAEKEAEVAAKAEAGYTPTSTPATGTPPVDTGKPAPKRVEKEDKNNGDISGIDDATKLSAFNKFKVMGANSYLSSSSGQNYEAFLKVQGIFAGQGKDFTLLQLVRIVDEQGAKKAGVDNGHLFEQKVVTWLASPEGTKYLKDNEAKLAKQAQEAKAQADIAAAAKKLEDNQPPLPADSALFPDMTPSKGLAFQEKMLTLKPFGPGEKGGLTHYTGIGYRTMNEYLRGISTYHTEELRRYIEGAKRGMRPSPEPGLFKRGTNIAQFGLSDESSIWGLTGKTVQDKGFLSTSANHRAAFGGKIIMEVEAPAGTKMMYVDNFSKHKGENEMILAPDTKMKVLNVRKEGATYIVRLRVVND
jgi:hypothetical protein